MTPPVFPNYLQMRQPVPLRLWQAARVVSVSLALLVVVLLLLAPDTGLTLWWGFIVPALPLIFFVAPGFWRNVCPMATLNQTPRVFGFTRALSLPPRLKEYGFAAGVAIFLVAVPSRKALFNDNGPALALLLLGVLALAFVGGLLFKGKSGWCSSGVCPLFAVQRVYGQTPYLTIPNAHCQTCVGCAKNCYDFNPRVAYLADLHDEDQHYRGYRKFFAGAFPGLVIAFYTIPDPPEIAVWEMYARFALALLASAGLFFLLDSYVKVTAQKTTALFGAAALSLYYWYNFPILIGRFGDLEDQALGDTLVWTGRLAVIGLAALWLIRTYQKERRFLAVQQARTADAGLSVAGTMALRRAKGLGQPEVTFVPENKRVVAERGRSLLEIIERNGLKIESGCRMGMCGADPVAVVEGMEHCSPVSDDERNTLERLGLASNTRMACVCLVKGDVSVSLKPERPKAFSSSVVRGFKPDPAVARVVIIGNGIAGITAADHVRRRHPACEITVVAKERHHLYNRMAIERLVYGRSAMQSLYLQDEAWYDDLKITILLNTRAVRIDRDAKQVLLGTGEALPYDKLILASGSRSNVPPIEGYGLPGSFVLREAEDALNLRAYAQEHACREAVVAGGGLLGLEAAHALHKLGLRTTVLERGEWLLRRQLDERGGTLLKEFLEGLGLHIRTGAETASISGQGRVRSLTLKDGSTLPCDIFLVAAGITPNIELAQEAGLTVNRAVVVDDTMRSSDPDIFAAGDVAEHRGTVYGLWPTAGEQAQVAAVNAVGGEQAYTGSVPVTMLKVVGVDLMSVGRFEATRPDDIVVALEQPEERRYRKLVINGGVVAGAILFGYPLLSPVVSAAIKRRALAGGVLDRLRAGDWEALAGLPEAPAGETPAMAAAVPAAPRTPAPAAVAAASPPATAPPPQVAAPPASASPASTPSPSTPEPVTPRAAEPATPPIPPAARTRIIGIVPGGNERREGDLIPGRARLRLRIEGGGSDGDMFMVAEAGATFGRDADNPIPIRDQGLSRRHARIEHREGTYWIVDLGSTNGTFVNGTKIMDPHPLASGDVIRAARTRIHVDVLTEGGL